MPSAPRIVGSKTSSSSLYVHISTSTFGNRLSPSSQGIFRSASPVRLRTRVRKNSVSVVPTIERFNGGEDKSDNKVYWLVNWRDRIEDSPKHIPPAQDDADCERTKSHHCIVAVEPR